MARPRDGRAPFGSGEAQRSKASARAAIHGRSAGAAATRLRPPASGEVGCGPASETSLRAEPGGPNGLVYGREADGVGTSGLV